MSGFFVLPTGNPNLGVGPEVVQSDWVWNLRSGSRSGGEIVSLDFAAASSGLATGATATYVPGTGRTVWNSVNNSSGTRARFNWLGVVKENTVIERDERGRVAFFGLVNAFVLASAGILPGTPLRPQGRTGSALIASSTGNRLAGIYLGPQATLRTRALRRVLWYGCCHYVVPRS